MFIRRLYFPDANQSGASSATESAKETTDKAFETAANAAVEAVLKGSESPTDEEKKEPSDAPLLSTTEGEDDKAASAPEKEVEKKEGEEVKKEEPATESDKDKKDAADKALPFNTHPRWKEVLAERDTAVTETTNLKRELETVKPLADAHKTVVDYCQTHDIPPKDFNDALQFLALRGSDPAKALEMLRPMVQGLEALVGQAIAPDLLQEVKDGVTTEERAKEITKLRADTKMREIRGEQSAQKQQDNIRAQMNNSVQTWWSSKEKTDPDFGKKTEFLNGIFATLINKTPPQNTAQVTALLEQAYTITNDKLAGFIPTKPKSKAPLNSTAVTSTKEPATLDEFANQEIDRILAAGK